MDDIYVPDLAKLQELNTKMHPHFMAMMAEAEGYTTGDAIIILEHYAQVLADHAESKAAELAE